MHYRNNPRTPNAFRGLDGSGIYCPRYAPTLSTSSCEKIMDPKELFDTKPKARLNILPEHSGCASDGAVVNLGRFPKWLHRKMPTGNTLWDTHSVIDKHRLHTVCEEAKCPNILECYSKKTATFF